MPLLGCFSLLEQRVTEQWLAGLQVETQKSLDKASLRLQVGVEFRFDMLILIELKTR
jgi:hypothetical protein